MGHDTNALIGRASVNLEKIQYYGLAVAFENDFAIVFLDDYHLLHWSRKLHLDYSTDNDDLQFGGELVHLFAKEIGFEDYVITYLSYKYYGELYRNAVKAAEGDINIVLQQLGVEVLNTQNEFHQLNLDDYRMSECYYWKGDSNWAKFRENIIAGHIED